MKMSHERLVSSPGLEGGMFENAALLIRFLESPAFREDGAGGRVVSTNFIISRTMGFLPPPFTPPFFLAARGLRLWVPGLVVVDAPVPLVTLAEDARFRGSVGAEAGSLVFVGLREPGPSLAVAWDKYREELVSTRVGEAEDNNSEMEKRTWYTD